MTLITITAGRKPGKDRDLRLHPALSERSPVRQLALLTMFVSACGGRAGAPNAGPTVFVVDSVVLAEPDSLEAFLPLRTQAMTAAGDVLLETGTAVLHFDRHGALRRVIGRPGTGPGEFVRISSLGLLSGDSLFATVDARRARISVFGLNDGALRREVVLSTPFFPDQQWVVMADTVIMPGKLRATPFTTWITTTDSIRHWGTAPPIFQTSLAAYSQGGEPALAPHDAGWLALFPTDPFLYVLNREGEPVGRVAVPATRRLGVPPDVADRVAAIAKTDSFRFAASLALTNRRLGNGQYLLMYLDADTELNRRVSDPSSGGSSVSFSNVRYWVSLLSADLSRACVDGPVPLDVENVLSPFFRRDTLFFVARRVDPAGRLRSVLYSYQVTDTGCRWLTTGGVQSVARER